MKQLRIGVVGVNDGWSSNRLADAVAERTGYRRLIQMQDVVIDVNAADVRHVGESLLSHDALIVKKVGAAYSPMLLDRMELLTFLRDRGVRVFSDPQQITLAMDRLSCTLALRRGDIPLPPTVVTEHIDEAIATVRGFGEAVLKPIYTSKARGMRLLTPADDVDKQVREFKAEGNDIIYIQKKMPLPGRDLGLVFLGGEYVGTYARVSNGNSWNTTTRSGGRYEAYEPSKDIIDIATRAQALFRLDFTSVDVAETPEGPVVFEVSAFGGFRGLLEANGLDAAARYADYVIGQLS